jgi:hypothetical protein
MPQNQPIASIAALSDLVTTKWQVDYPAALNATGKLADLLSSEVVTNTESAQLAFINTWKGLEEIPLYGNPTYESVIAEYFTVRIARYAKAIRIGRFNWAEPNAQSLLMTQLDGLVADAAARRTRRISFLLENGDSSTVTSYDGSNLFSTHTLNGVSFDNLLTGNPLDATGIQAAKDVLKSVPLGPDGTSLPTDNARFVVVVPHQLEFTAATLFNATLTGTFTSGSGSLADFNPIKQFGDYEVSTFLTDPNDWYMFMIIPGISPFVSVRHVEQEGSLIPRIAANDINVIERNEYLWNLQVIEETYPVHYYTMVKCTNS